MDLLHVFLEFPILLLKFELGVLVLVVGLPFFIELNLKPLFGFLYLIGFFLVEFLLLSEFFLKIEQIGVCGDSFVDFLDDFFGLSILEDHSPHLNVELVVDFRLHTLVHRLHKLLHDIFYVFDVLVVVKSLFETLVDAHNLRVAAERCVV